MSYQRLFLHYGPNQTDVKGVLSQRAVKKCWFELHRLGGCGAGEIRLSDEFANRDSVEPGDWIACEYATGDRWYFGRVEQVEAESPAGVRIRLEGPAIELNEVFPGAFSPTAAGKKPHRYARTDLFSYDPDVSLESVDLVMNSAELIRKLIQQYVVPNTKIQYVPSLVETGPLVDDVTSVKFRGEESVRSIIKELAVRARNASWGVDAAGQFFFLQQKSTVLAQYTENIDLTRLKQVRSRELLFNRVVLTGDYVYDRRDQSMNLARRSYRWRGNYRQPDSIALYGERRIRLSVPWIRSREDSRSFVSEFFRIYATPTARYFFETAPQSSLPAPWLGVVKVFDRDGVELSSLQPEKIRVQFDHRPQFQIELGPGDPRDLWPEPPQDERWELPDNVSDYGESDFSGDPPPPSGSGPGNSQGNSSGGGPGNSNSLSLSGSSAQSQSSASSAGSVGSSVSSLISSWWHSSSGIGSSAAGSSVFNSSNAGSSSLPGSSAAGSSIWNSSYGIESTGTGGSSYIPGSSGLWNSSGGNSGSSLGGSSAGGSSWGGNSGGSQGGNSSGGISSGVGGSSNGGGASSGQNSSQPGTSGGGASTSSAGGGTSVSGYTSYYLSGGSSSQGSYSSWSVT